MNRKISFWKLNETRKATLIVKEIILTIVVFALVIVFSGEVKGTTSEVIKIGVISPNSGPPAEIGIAYSDAIRTYFRHINDQGGINGRSDK